MSAVSRAVPSRPITAASASSTRVRSIAIGRCSPKKTRPPAAPAPPGLPTATRLLEQGIEARVVQILLGHVNIATTAVYLHLTEPTRASLKATLDKLMTDL